MVRQAGQPAVKPRMVLKGISTGIEPRQKFSPAISVKLANTAPQLMTKLKIDGRIYDQNNHLAYQTKRHSLGMAPASNFDYLINTGNHRLKAGNYRVHLVATAGKQRWVFNRHFTISRKAATKANAETPRDWRWLWWLLLLLLILVVLWLAYRLGKHQATKKQRQ